MRKIGSRKSRKLFFGRLVAAGTARARKCPAPQAKRADDFEGESFALWAKASGLWSAFAPWAVEATRKIRGIRLQQGSRKKLKSRELSWRIPVFRNQVVEISPREFASRVCERLRTGADDEV